MNRQPPSGDTPDPSDQRYSPWTADQQASETRQPDRTGPRYPDANVLTYLPGLDYRPGQRN